MKSRDYLVNAKKCEKRATKMHRLEDREWQLVLARAYRVLAESEMEAAAQRKRQESSRPQSWSHRLVRCRFLGPRRRGYEPESRPALHPIQLIEPLEKRRDPPSEDLPLARQGTPYGFALRF
jgi:hypothetical protein